MSNNKPTALNNLNNLPDELKECVQWVVCNNVKVPINARLGTHASSTDPSTWSSFGKAREVVLSGKYKHVGFVLTEDGPYTIIDLDHVIDLETGEIEPWAKSIIDKMDSYTEISQSGTGIHIIIRGKKPGELCRKGNIEIYDQGRLLCAHG